MRTRPTATPPIFILVLAFVAVLGATTVPARAQQLMVYPTRLTFEGSVRSAQVQLFNQGSKEASYRISVIRMRMDENGGIRKVDAALPGELFAEELIRFSPRQVVIPAGGAQTVRVQLRKPAELPAGEYRSHLLFQALPEPVPAKPASDAGLTVTLRPIVSVSIPLIVLQGATSSTVSIENALLHPAAKSGGMSTISFELARLGSRSTYGDITVHRKSGRSAETTIAQIKGVAVYSPNPRRIFRIPVAGPTDGEISISFREKRERGEGGFARISLSSTYGERP